MIPARLSQFSFGRDGGGSGYGVPSSLIRRGPSLLAGGTPAPSPYQLPGPQAMSGAGQGLPPPDFPPAGGDYGLGPGAYIQPPAPSSVPYSPGLELDVNYPGGMPTSGMPGISAPPPDLMPPPAGGQFPAPPGGLGFTSPGAAPQVPLDPWGNRFYQDNPALIGRGGISDIAAGRIGQANPGDPEALGEGWTRKIDLARMAVAARRGSSGTRWPTSFR
jgi:hypothetical protein